MRIVFLLGVFCSFTAVASNDDSIRFKAAKFYKEKAQSSVNSQGSNIKGSCQLMLTMEHINQKQAKLKRIKHTGSTKVCKYAKAGLKPYINKKVRYDFTEKYLRIEINRW